MLGDESVDTVWTESLPVLPVFEEDDGGGIIAETLSQFQGLLVSRDIPLHELNTQIIQSFLRETTGLARRRGEDSDHE